MGIQYKCDKCGVVKDKEMSEVHLTRQRNTQYGYDKCKYLCEKCYENLFAWFGQ